MTPRTLLPRLRPRVAGTQMTPLDQANVTRLRKLQRQANANLNAIAWRISDIGDIRPSAAQWAVLWPALEAVIMTVQGVADELAAAHADAVAQRRRLRDANAQDADETEVS